MKTPTPYLFVRKMTVDDISLVADYWLKATPTHLLGMGVDLAKLPTREELTQTLRQQIGLPLEEKASYALVWLMDGELIGHTNVNPITYGRSAYMHLHLWHPKHRQQGIGLEFVRKSLPFFFKHLQLQKIYCEPYALNLAPNKTLLKVGFVFEKMYTTTPSSLNFEQEVNRYKLTKERFEELKHTCL